MRAIKMYHQRVQMTRTRPGVFARLYLHCPIPQFNFAFNLPHSMHYFSLYLNGVRW